MQDYPQSKIEVGDGRAVYLFPITFDRWRVAIGPSNEAWYDDVW